MLNSSPDSSPPSPWSVYIVRCADGTLYTGITNNVERRIATHNQGKGAKYTKPYSRRPVTLLYIEEVETRGEALSREYRIKQMKRAEKLEMISLANPTSTPNDS